MDRTLDHDHQVDGTLIKCMGLGGDGGKVTQKAENMTESAPIGDRRNCLVNERIVQP